MIESFLTQNLVERGETAIVDYLRTDQSDYSNLMKESFADLLLDFDEMGFDWKQLCERLSIQSSVTKTAAFTGAASDEDFAQRMRLVIPVTAITGDAIFTLQGTDDDGTNYEDITLVSDDGTASTTVTISAAAFGDSSNSYLITRPFKKYRLKLISIGNTVTYSSYFIEEVYTILHRDKTRANIYRSLMANEADLWTGKWEQYESVYNGRLANGRFRVDYTDDNKISETEGEKHTGHTRIGV